MDDADADTVHFLRLARRRGWIADCRVHRDDSRCTPVTLEVETQVGWKRRNTRRWARSARAPIIISEVVVEQVSALLYNACVRALFMCVIANKELETNKVIHHKMNT